MRSLVRQVAKTLPYQTVDQLIGVRVEVPRLECLVKAAKEAIERSIPDFYLTVHPKFDQERLSKVFAKYRFADLEFKEHSVAIDSVPTGGVPLLRELGFVFHRAELEEMGGDDDMSHDFDLGCLKHLHEEICDAR